MTLLSFMLKNKKIIISVMSAQGCLSFLIRKGLDEKLCLTGNKKKGRHKGNEVAKKGRQDEGVVVACREEGEKTKGTQLFSLVERVNISQPL